MAGRLLILLPLPFTSTLRNPNSSLAAARSRRRREHRWATNGLKNARGPTSAGPRSGFGPVDDPNWPGGGHSSPSSKQRTWWIDEDDDDYGDDDGGYFGWELDDEDAGFPILKIIKAFGWMLPAIGISLLMGTGTNAFVMAIAVPLVQKSLSLVFDKVWGSVGSSPRGRSRNKSRKKPFSRASHHAKRAGNDIKEETKNGKGTGSYQSWMGTAKNGSYRKSDSRRGQKYGGWDELDGVSQGQNVTIETPIKDTNGPQMQPRTSKLSRVGRVRDKPLLVRLLIAVFPFLGSWTRFLL